MEVTRTNFTDALKQISQAVEECSFLAIDGEFTGLNHSGLSPSQTFDTPEERYHKLLQGSTDFLLVQFGLCAFSYDGKSKQYSAKPFNCYVFPKPSSRSAPDIRFSCQSSSMDFLISQGFDFNKTFREGIPYLTSAQEQKLRDAVKKKHEQFSAFSSPAFTTPNGGGSEPQVTKGPITVPSEHQEFIDNVCESVEKFLGTKEEESLSLPPCTGFQRKLTYQVLQSKHGQEIYLKTQQGEKKERYIEVTRVLGEDDMKRKEEKRQTEEMEEVDDAVGFTKVIKLISQSGKLVIGHNMLLDLAHTLHQFMFNLPQDYSEFKSMTKCVFPRLLDTKLMASTQPFKEQICNTGLDSLHKTLQREPFKQPDIVLAEGFEGSYGSSELLHEAGYDAYITGCCFIALANYLGEFQAPKSDHVPATSPLLEPFVNKLHMMRSLDIPYMDLAGPDLSPARDNVLHITFPEEWKPSDLFQLFSPYGNIQIGWLDDTSALVALNSKTSASSVVKSLGQAGAAFSLMTYADYKKPVLAGHRTVDHRVPAKRPAPTENTDHVPVQKKQKTLNVKAPPFESRITPTPSPEKLVLDEVHWPKLGSSGSASKRKASPADKMFTEPQEW